MEEKQLSTDRFKAEMPRIPGVEVPSPAASFGKSTLLTIALGVAVVVIGGIGWWAVRFASHRALTAPAVAETSPEPSERTPLSLPKASGPVAAATLSDLAKPWAAKEFSFVDPVTGSSVPSMLVHLGGEAPNSSESYWAFSLEAPYQTCQLQYITDLSELAKRFDYHGTHPMVASPCDGTVYDPLKLGTIASGAWVRGEIVQGAGIRPPISIEIKVEGNKVIADRIE